jgi:lipopolysaccharide transport system permease protein
LDALLDCRATGILLFVFSGLLGWNLFAGILQRGGNSLVAEARLISKVYFPRLLIPLAAAGSALVDFGVSTLVMVVLLFWFEVWPGSNLLLLPLGLLLILALGVGASLWLAALNVRYRDFGYTLPFLIQLWMFASPVVYGVALLESGFRPWFALNPMVGAIELLRAALLGDSSLGWDLVMPGAAISFLVLITGVLFFRRAERGFADVL